MGQANDTASVDQLSLALSLIPRQPIPNIETLPWEWTQGLG